MIFWKSIAIALAVILGISYAAFAYVYSQGGGIMIAGMVTGGMQPKVVTLLKNQNITLSWNGSAGVTGYKTGFLYCQVFQIDENHRIGISTAYETDSILAAGQGLGQVSTLQRGRSWEIELTGTRMWVMLVGYDPTPPYEPPRWAVLSLSLYLRD